MMHMMEGGEHDQRSHGHHTVTMLTTITAIRSKASWRKLSMKDFRGRCHIAGGVA